MTTIELWSIGTVESSLTDLASAPHQADEGAPEAWLTSANAEQRAGDRPTTGRRPRNAQPRRIAPQDAPPAGHTSSRRSVKELILSIATVNVFNRLNVATRQIACTNWG